MSRWIITIALVFITIILFITAMTFSQPVVDRADDAVIEQSAENMQESLSSPGPLGAPSP